MRKQKTSIVKALERQIKKGSNDNDPADVLTKDQELIAELKRNLKTAVQAKSEWNEVAKEDIEFALGKQWDDKDVAALKEQGRPALTFNLIKPLINLVEGHSIQNNARIEVKPEGGEDEVFSKVMDKALAHIEKVTHLDYQLSLLRTSGLRAGRSWLEFYVDYDEDPIFGNLKVPFLGPFKVFVDPNSMEYDLSDAAYAHKVIKTTKARLKQFFPKKAQEIDELGNDAFDNEFGPFGFPQHEGGNNDYGNDPRKATTGLNQAPDAVRPVGDAKKMTVVEYWYRKPVEKVFVYYQTGSMRRYENMAEAEADIKAIGAVNPIIRPRKVNEMWVAVVVNDLILEHGKSGFEPHYHGFPFFHFTSEWSPDAMTEEFRVIGLVRSLKDPQREKNKSRSQYLHILNSSANSGWKGPEGALTKQGWADLQAFGAKPGYCVKLQDGKDIERIHPIEPSLAVQVREKAASDDIKAVSGINADLLSVDTSSAPSGKAIALRIRQAITILEPMFQNFRYTKLLIGQFIFRIMPTLFDAPKLAKVLGEQFMLEYKLDIGQLQGFLTIIEDGKYNVAIAEQGSSKTQREETLESLMQLVQAGMQFPPDVILEFMNMPNKQEVLTKVQAFQQQQQMAMMAAAQAKAGGNGQSTRF